MSVDAFTSATPTFRAARALSNRPMPLTAYEVAETGRRSSWWLVLAGLIVFTIGMILTRGM